MPHGPLAPVPILTVPKEVADQLIEAGLATPSRNPLGEFSAGEWWTGLLSFSGGIATTITLVQGATSVPDFARRLKDWLTIRKRAKPEDGTWERQMYLSFRGPRGMARLDLTTEPSFEILEAWLALAYVMLKEDAEGRDDSAP